MSTTNITPCLWFNNNAEEAVNFYLGIFENSSKGDVLYYSKEGKEIHGHQEGEVLTIEFTLDGMPFTALNGGADFKFNESVSFQVFCDDQEEIDYYWDKLTDGGEESVCGWLKDKYGVSWQVVPNILKDLLQDPSRADRVTKVFMQMKKFDIAKLKEA